MINVDSQITEKSVKKIKSNLYATGKRKNSIARVWLIPKGKGEIKENKKDLNKYLSRSLLNMIVKKHFETINNMDEAFITSSAIGVLPCQWNGWKSDFNITQKLKNDYKHLVENQ